MARISKKIHIRKSDYNRVLLTDVHPYEVPFILTNEGFYKELSNGTLMSNDIVRYIFGVGEVRDTIPYSYEIAKDSEDTRKLYLIHPASQIAVSELYKGYHQLISYLCDRSSFSLRYPHKIAYAYRTREEPDVDKVDVVLKGEGVDLEDPKYASSFFEYRKFSFLYKFYDSYDFHRIEKKFNHLYKFDIAKCFGSISTFNVPLSLKDVSSYKNSIGDFNFENNFRRVMESLYNGNSHGIVVGPEFARIFAEILLQSIDVKIKSKLASASIDGKLGIKQGEQYELRRYVDDYFLFYNDESIRKIVHSVAKGVLEDFKLYCNDSKNVKSSVPFISGVSIAKLNVSRKLNEYFDLFSKDENDSSRYIIKHDLRRYSQVSNKIITEIKCIVFESKAPYSSVTGYFFSMIRIRVMGIESEMGKFSSDESQSERLVRFFLILIDFIFFIYSMDFRVRSTYLISQIIIIINRIFSDLKEEYKMQIKKKIYDEVSSAISFSMSKGGCYYVESLNILIALKFIEPKSYISTDKIKKFIGLFDVDTLNYFNAITFLFVFGKDPDYLSDVHEVSQHILSKLKRATAHVNIMNDSELCHLFFDSLSCPFIDDVTKEQILSASMPFLPQMDSGELKNLLDIIKTRMWFVDWHCDTSDAIERLLHKKELKSPYS